MHILTLALFALGWGAVVALSYSGALPSLYSDRGFDCIMCAGMLYLLDQFVCSMVQDVGMEIGPERRKVIFEELEELRGENSILKKMLGGSKKNKRNRH